MTTKPVGEPAITVSWTAIEQLVIRDSFKKAGFTNEEVQLVSKDIFEKDKEGQLHLPLRNKITSHRVCKLPEPTLQKLDKCFGFIVAKLGQTCNLGKGEQILYTSDPQFKSKLAAAEIYEEMIRVEKTIKNEITDQDEVVKKMLNFEKTPKKFITIIDANPQLKEKFMQFIKQQIPKYEHPEDILQFVSYHPGFTYLIDRFELSISHELAVDPKPETLQIIKPLLKKAPPEVTKINEKVLEKRKTQSRLVKAAMAAGPITTGIGIGLLIAGFAFPPLFFAGAAFCTIGFIPLRWSAAMYMENRSFGVEQKQYLIR